MLRKVAAAVLATSALAMAAAPLAAQDADARRAAYDAMPDTAGDGPYPALIERDARIPDHIVYRPADLSALDGRKLGVVVWGNGGCVPDGTSARLHLAQIASYGYLVIAPGDWLSGPNRTGERPPPRQPDAEGNRPPPATSSAQVAAGIDWALAENAREGSRYHGLVDDDAIAVAGHSCGGLQAIEVATSDSRIATVLIHNSGIFDEGVPSISGMELDKSYLERFHSPVLYVLGGPDDIAYGNGTDDFSRIDNVPVMLLDKPVGHGGTFIEPMGGEVGWIAVDWLEWQLRGSSTAARTFTGENCRLCNGTDGWTLEAKNWP